MPSLLSVDLEPGPSGTPPHQPPDAAAAPSPFGLLDSHASNRARGLPWGECQGIAPSGRLFLRGSTPGVDAGKVVSPVVV